MKMKKQLDIKKLLLLNMPYILMGLFATNFGEGWRMAVGADASAKMLSFFSTLPVALASWWPSLHPFGPAGGAVLAGAGLRLPCISKARTPRSTGTVWSMAAPAGAPMRTSHPTSTRCSRTM